MKNKISISTKLLLLSAFVLTATQVFAGYGSSGDTYDCPDLNGQGTNCVTFHNNGYTGGTGGANTDYRYGLPFASFNGYKDQKTEDGRAFNERQFLYIESLSVAQSINGEIPYPSPWDNPSDYNFGQGQSVNINFVNNQTQRVGFWGYMHNNGEANKYPAYDTTIKIDGWGSWSNPVPQTQYSPRLNITSTNTKPRSVWSNVAVSGSQAFVLVPKEFYMVRESDMFRNSVEYLSLNTPEQIRNVTTTGFKISSDPSYAPAGQMGKFDSSQIHYVKVYLEFEAVPQVETPKVCRDLQIIKPDGANDNKGCIFCGMPTVTVGATGLNNELVQVQLDADAGAVDGYEFFSSQGSFTFDGQPQSGTIGYRTNNTSVRVTGTPKNGEYIWVWAMQADDPEEYWGECSDAFKMKLEEGGKECAELKTDPGSAGIAIVDLNVSTSVEIDTLIDTNGDPYRLANGGYPNIKYCYNQQQNIDYTPAQYKTTNGCAVAPSNVQISFTATKVGMLTIQVVGSEAACHDSVKTKPANVKECAKLKTDPGSAGVAVVDLNVSTPVEIDTLIDTNGAPYMEENGDYPTIRYCYNQKQNIEYTPAQYVTTNGCAEAPSNVQISFTATKVGMLTIEVVGAESVCHDYVKTYLGELKECAELTTDPGRTHTSNYEVGDEFPIDVESLLDTENDDYRDNDGNVPTLLYCYSGNIDYDGNYQPWFDITSIRNLTPDIEFFDTDTPQQTLSKFVLLNRPLFVFETEVSEKCILASADTVITVTPLEEGTMTIRTIGVAGDVCTEEFDIGKQPEEGQCEDLTINQPRFYEGRTSYSADVETTPEDLDYNIEWSVERPGEGEVFSEEITNSDEIDLADYEDDYSYEPGDILIAQATDIENADDCVDRLTSEEKDCEDFNLDRDEFIRDDQEICFYTDWPVTDLEYETSEGDTDTLDVDDNCFILERNVIEDATWIDIWVPDFEDVCKDRLTYKIEPPDFDKNVRDEGGAGFVNRAVSNFSDDFVDYEITYTHHNDGVQDVTITDTLGVDGIIYGYVGNEKSGGEIKYMEGSMENNSIGGGVFVNGSRIESCDEIDTDDEDALCFDGDIGDPRGVTIYNVPNDQEVRIQYRGLIDSAVNVDNCSARDSLFNTTGICGETYTNESEFEDEFTSGSSKSEIMIPCPYIIIRSGGDVLLENPLDYGVDTLACADIANFDAPLIKPKPPTPGQTPSTGPGSTASPTFTPAICKNQAEGEEGTGYENIEGVSSLICEVSLKTSEELQQRAIILNILDITQKVTRFEQNLNDKEQINSVSDLPESVNGVYYKNSGSLTLGDGSTDLKFTKGAKTIIVENGDILINSKIIYEDDKSALLDARNVASLTLIVINGSININTNETAGVFLTVEGDREGSGQICEKTCKDEEQYNPAQYIHYGSIYGDINNLLKYRTYSGDPTKEEGAVVIRFDSRIYLNPSIVLLEILPASEFVLS